MIECYGVLPPGIALGDTVRVYFANGEQDIGYAGEMSWRHASPYRRDSGYNIVKCEIISRYEPTESAASKEDGT